ncbi:MAG: hypothetical protein AUF76_12740, partial [Acidobacteria bacterium 13_1_20CM_2_65_9]
MLAILPAIARTIELTHEGHAMLTILADVAQDIRYVSRTLRRSPGFAAAIIVTLALGVGANTAVFSVVNAVLLRPLPYPNPDRIVMLMNTWRGRVSPSSGVSPPKIILWRQSTTAFTDIATYTFGRSLNLTNPRDPHVIGVARVSIDFFRLFGARVAQGRAFSAAEDRPGGPHVAVISDRFWRNQLGQSSRAIGQAVSLDSDLFTVIGVLDSDFDGRALSPSLADGPDIWLPLQMDPDTSSDLNVYFAAARLREEVSFELARTETAHAADLVRRTFPGVMPVDNGLTVERLQAVFVRDVRPALLLLWAAVTVVLLIACANTVNLLLVRASVREREMAIRVATGASGGRIVRQLLTESVALAMAGGGAGLVVGAIGTRVLLSIQAWNLPSFGPEGSRVAMDVHVLAFTLITSLGIGVAFGVVPALRAMRVDVDDQLKTGSRGRSDTSAHSVRSGVVVVEVALALMLLVGAALLIRSFVAVRRVEPGFDTHHVLTMQTALIGRHFASGRAVSGLVTDALHRLEALPDVEVAASTLTGVPLDAGAALNVSIVGRPRDDEYYALGWNVVSPEYFDALKIPLVRGRFFSNRDGERGAPVALVNEAMARRYWSDGDPLRDALVIAPRIGGDIEETVPRHIIGVVGDVRHHALRQDLGVYLTWIVRTRGEPHRIADVIQNEIRTASGGLPPVRVRSMDQVSAASTGQSQHQMWVTTTFSAVAMLLAAVGLYGVMSYSVEQRRIEIGIRLALGADVKQVRRMILAQGMKLTGLGIAGGIAAALGLTRTLAGFLFGVQEHDPLVFVGVPLLLCAVAVAAMWIPARSASSVDPMTA